MNLNRGRINTRRSSGQSRVGVENSTGSWRYGATSSMLRESSTVAAGRVGNINDISTSQLFGRLKNYLKGIFLGHTGGKLKLTRRHRPDYWMFVLTVALALFGLVIIFSIAPAIYDGDTSKINREMLKRAAFLLLGIIAFFITSQISLDKWKRWGPYIFLFGLFICLALPLLGMVHAPIATCALGACRWYDFKVVSFQPAELLKLGTVLFMAGYLSTKIATGKLNTNATLIEVLTVMVLTLGVIVGLQKDMGTGIALAAIFMVELFMSGMEAKKIGLVIGIMLLFGVAFIAIAPHRMARIFTFTKSGNDESDYHINQALIALGSGGLTGRGLGQSVQAFGWLPEAVNDSIFAVIGETLGYVGVITLIAVFAGLMMKMFNKINYLESPYLRLVVAGVVGWFASHVLLNVGAMTHLIPLTGITLPLVSSGGTSLVLVMGSLGIVFEISRYTSHRKVTEIEADEQKGEESYEYQSAMRGRRQRRPYHADSGDSRPIRKMVQG